MTSYFFSVRWARLWIKPDGSTSQRSRNWSNNLLKKIISDRAIKKLRFITPLFFCHQQEIKVSFWTKIGDHQSVSSRPGRIRSFRIKSQYKRKIRSLVEDGFLFQFVHMLSWTFRNHPDRSKIDSWSLAIDGWGLEYLINADSTLGVRWQMVRTANKQTNIFRLLIAVAEEI